MDRIIIHWTAGSHTPNGLDLSHYHYVIDGKGQIHAGKWPVSANRSPLQKGAYAAHTLNGNSNAIGIAVAAMAGAVERPFSAGKWPITEAQMAALYALIVRLCDEHGIGITPQTVLSHAEVQPTLGIAQRGKWDVSWIPGMSSPGDPVLVGNVIRERVRAVRRVTPDPAPARKTSTITATTPAKTGFFAWLSGLFKGKTK